MNKVNMLEAKTNLSRLVEAVESGRESEIVIARNGRPVARIVPLEAEQREVDVSRRLGIADGQFGDIGYEAFQALDEEIAARMLNSTVFPAEAAPEPRRRKRRA